jgi:RNA recognition motif-containing protein
MRLCLFSDLVQTPTEKGRTLKRLYIGNIPYTCTEDDLRAFFEQSGLQVANVTLIRDRTTGNPKGFGFVETNSDEEAQAAIEKLNGQNFMGRNLVINEARPPRDFGGGRGGRDSGGSSRRRY